MQILSNTLALIVVLSVLVVVHEFGHFAVAKAFGFPVKVFWSDSGSACSAASGRHGLSRLRDPARRLRPGHRARARRVDHTRALRRPRPSGSAGSARYPARRPLHEPILAIVLHTVVFAVGVRVPAYELAPAVVGVVAEGSPGAEKSLAPGDRIVSINGTATTRWRDAEYMIAVNARSPLDVEVERGGVRRISGSRRAASESTTTATSACSRTWAATCAGGSAPSSPGVPRRRPA